MSRQVLVAGEWLERLTQAGLDDVGVLLDEPFPPPNLAGRWHALTKAGLGGRQRWRWELDADTTLYLKRYRATPLREQLDRIRRQAARHSRAWWEFHQAGVLARQHIPAAQAVALAEQMRGCWELRSAVLLEPVAGDAVDRVWTRLRAQHDPLTYGRPYHELTRSLARFISAFHQTGICHRDLYLCHVFVDLGREAWPHPRFALLDLARTHRPYWRRARWLLKDLSQLDTAARQIGCARTDRLRFLLAYLGLQPRAPRARWYARRVVRKSDAILRRIARRVRTLGPCT